MSDNLNLNIDSPEDLQRLFDDFEAGKVTEGSNADTTNVDPSVNDGATQAKDVPAADNQSSDGKQTNAAEPEPDGVATKDGKHIIPYSVLQGERARAARAEEIAQQAQQRLEELQAQLQQSSQGAKTGESARTEPTAVEQEISEVDLEALKEDFPTVYKAVKSAMARANAIEQRLNPVAETVHAQQAQQQRSEAELVQEAIDSVPKLAHIQANNKDAFALARQFDATLRAQPAWAGKSLSERFAKVTEMVESAIGEIELPAGKQSLGTKEDVSNKAKALATQAANAPQSVPTSLSEFPAGKAPAESEVQALESMSATQLAEKFGRMSPDQMDAYFSNLS